MEIKVARRSVGFWPRGFLTVCIMQLPGAFTAYGMNGFQHPLEDLNWDPTDKVSLGSLSYGSFSKDLSAFQRLLQRSSLKGFGEGSKSFLREQGVHPLIEIRTQRVSAGAALGLAPKGQGLDTGGESYDFRFYLKGVPLCDFHARSHLLSDGSGFLTGDVPTVHGYDPDLLATQDTSGSWPDLETAQQRIKDSLFSDQFTDDAASFYRPERCFFIKDQRLIPVWRQLVRWGGAPYQVLANHNDVFKMEPQFFTVDGKATSYGHNKTTPATTERALIGLVGDGTLTTEWLKTVVPDGFPKAKEPSHVFSYAPTDRKIEEVTAFANAQDHLRWFQNLGFQWYGPKPLEVRIHIKPQNKANNALFEPGDETANTPPTITIDDGDGVELQNLVTDGDVVSHEMGHHIIFRTLKSVSDQSLVLHEGLSDYFVFARTGDPCLGETICPADSGQCMQPGKCLRSAANRLVFNDANWQAFSGTRTKQLGHLHGQLISGMMWDMRSSNQISNDDLARLTLKAVSLFAETSSFCQFIRALYAADKDMFAGKYFELIKFVGGERGLGEFTDPTKECPAGSLPRDQAKALQTTEKKEKKDTGVSCSTISGGTLPPGGSPWSLFVVLGSPILMLFSLRLLTRRLRPIESHPIKIGIFILIVAAEMGGVTEPTQAFAAEKPAPVTPKGSTHTKPSKSHASATSPRPFQPDASVTLSILVQWGGRAINPEDIAAVESLRTQYPQFEIVHLISPAYFLRSSKETQETAAILGRLVRPNDYYGLNLGGWKSLVTQAGVIFRSSPTFWGSSLTLGECRVDCGGDIPLHVYPEADLQKIMDFALKTMETKVLGRPKAMVVTGWVASGALSDLATKHGLTYDFSPVPPEVLEKQFSYYPVYEWVKDLWSQVTPMTSPFFRTTANGRLYQYPQSLGGVDHQPFGTLVQHLEKALLQWPSTPSDGSSGSGAVATKNLIVPIVIYLETAETTAPRVAQELGDLINLAQKNKVRVLKQTFGDLVIPLPSALVVAKADLKEPIAEAAAPPLKTPPVPVSEQKSTADDVKAH